MENSDIILTSSIEYLNDPEVYEAALASLPPARYEKLMRLRIPDDRKRSAAAWKLLEQGLSDWFFLHRQKEASKVTEDFSLSDLQKSFALTGSGKPYLDIPGAPHFSISHSGNYVMCVVSECEVGCDTEVIPDTCKIANYDRISDHCFGEREKQQLAAFRDEKERAVMFCRLWTLKEAYVKAVGKGLSIPFSSFEICLEGVCPQTCGSADSSCGDAGIHPGDSADSCHVAAWPRFYDDELNKSWKLYEYPRNESSCFAACRALKIT